jgi:hypothetical protein
VVQLEFERDRIPAQDGVYFIDKKGAKDIILILETKISHVKYSSVKVYISI